MSRLKTRVAMAVCENGASDRAPTPFYTNSMSVRKSTAKWTDHPRYVKINYPLNFYEHGSLLVDSAGYGDLSRRHIASATRMKHSHPTDLSLPHQSGTTKLVCCTTFLPASEKSRSQRTGPEDLVGPRTCSAAAQWRVASASKARCSSRDLIGLTPGTLPK
jgi:hypothetical protein